MSRSTGTVFTHCQICEQLCGVAVSVEEGRISSIRPDKENPYTWHDFCVKGQQADTVSGSPWRVTSPMRRDGAGWVAASYAEALDDIASRLRAIIDQHGPDAVGGYVGNPMGFSFGAVAFHSAFLGALGTHQKYGVQSIDSNSKHVACDAVFGLETLALIPDIDETDVALLIGTNPAVSKFNWGGKVPNGWGRLRDRVRHGARLVVVDPRRTETAAHATTHLQPYPETDWALLLGILKVVLAEGLERLPAEAPLEGLDRLRAVCSGADLTALAELCDLPQEAIVQVAREFALAERAFAFAATGPALGRHGVLTHWLTLVLNLVTDRVDRPGGRFAPNWPYNLALKEAERPAAPRTRSRVRGLEPVVGQHSLSELADEILTPGAGQVRALILGGGNPVSTGPDGRRLEAALAQLELLVSVDLFQRESHRDAHWLIPAVHWLERDEVNVALHAFNDRPFIQASRQVVPPPEGVRPEWTFYRDLGKALGLDLFGGLVDSPDALAAGMLATGGQLDLATVRAADHGIVYGERTMGHLWEHYRSGDRGIDLCPDRLSAELTSALTGDPRVGAPPAGLFRMISRRRNRLMNASLSETSGSVGKDDTAETVEINHDDAAGLGISEDDALEVRSECGAVAARARLSKEIRRGTVVMVQGWGSPLYAPGTSSEVFHRGNARNKLVSDADLDPLSGVPRLNGTLVSLHRAVTGEPPAEPIARTSCPNQLTEPGARTS